MQPARSTLTLAATAGLAALAALVLVVTVATAPLVGGADAPASIADKDKLVVGIKGDQPRLSAPDGSSKGKPVWEGFEVDVAKYVAGQLNVSGDDLEFVKVRSDQREKALEDGKVDMVIATYSITPDRKDKVTFAGPYYVAHQDILVRLDDRSVSNVRDLRGKSLCAVSGSNSWERVTKERGIAANLSWRQSYADCVKALAGGRVAAVSTDDLILAGFAAASNYGVTMVNAPFTNERYGIGLPKGDLKGCRLVNDYLTRMYQEGAAETLLEEWFSTSGLKVTTTVPQFEGCE